MGKAKECYDHLGNKFSSETIMCKYYGISRCTYRDRLNSGWSIGDALTTPIKTINKCKDHLGNEYNSQAEMCRYYGVNIKNYYERIRLGWTLEDALTKKGIGIECYDHLGNKFDSKKDMCEYYGKSLVLVTKRLNSGWTLKDALTKNVKEAPKNTYHDHLGNEYKSREDMCRHYGIKGSTFQHRLKLGWSVEDALITPAIEREKRCKDHLGNNFKSIGDMCAYYGIDSIVFNARVRNGWNTKDALTIPANNEKKCKDPLGNQFNSHKEMCEHYGIGYEAYNARMKKHNWNLSDALGISGKGLDIDIRNRIIINSAIHNINRAYRGIDGKVYYTCIDNNTGEELLLNADEILVYKQKDYKTAVEQLIARRRGVYNG